MARFNKFYALGKLIFSGQEIKDLIFAWLAVAVIFTFAFRPSNNYAVIILYFIIYAFFAGLGVILHELSHKFVAQKYHYNAFFIANYQFTIVSLIIAVFGIVLIAPGAVYITPAPDRKSGANIAIAGPAMNVALALLFIALAFASPSFKGIFALGAVLNSYLALFNLLPFPGFDGSKVWGADNLKGAVVGILSILAIAISYAMQSGVL